MYQPYFFNPVVQFSTSVTGSETGVAGHFNEEPLPVAGRISLERVYVRGTSDRVRNLWHLKKEFGTPGVNSVDRTSTAVSFPFWKK